MKFKITAHGKNSGTIDFVLGKYTGTCYIYIQNGKEFRLAYFSLYESNNLKLLTNDVFLCKKIKKEIINQLENTDWNFHYTNYLIDQQLRLTDSIKTSQEIIEEMLAENERDLTTLDKLEKELTGAKSRVRLKYVGDD